MTHAGRHAKEDALMVDETTDTENQPDEGQLEVTVDLPPDAGGDGAAKLREQIETLEKEKKETYDRLLRAAADLDNYRKRTRKEIDEARAQAREAVLKEILPGIDNLERALAAAGSEPAAGSVVEGLRLVLRQFLSALERLEVKPFDAVGQPFDPTRHEAISQVTTEAHPPGTVATEMQRGYTIGNRLLRPALVGVAKPPELPSPTPEEQG
jgi:molecular chaperone GrpE